MLNVVLWKWDQPSNPRKYSADHVNVMCAMLRRNLSIPHRIVCVTDDAKWITECETAPLWSDCFEVPNATGAHLPSCYRRLKLYDRATQKSLGIDKGDRIMGLDLDSLITGDIRELVATQGEYVGWHLMNWRNEMTFNGSLQMFTAGTLQDIWSDFDPATSPKAARDAGYKGSDQAWLTYKLITRPGAVGLRYPLVSSFPLQNAIQGEPVPETRIVFFHGSVKPWDADAQSGPRWINQYWRT
jgi:hypothetical protein